MHFHVRFHDGREARYSVSNGNTVQVLQEGEPGHPSAMVCAFSMIGVASLELVTEDAPVAFAAEPAGQAQLDPEPMLQPTGPMTEPVPTGPVDDGVPESDFITVSDSNYAAQEQYETAHGGL